MENYRTYKYRWVILCAIIPIIICTEMFWLTLAPIASEAEAFYKVDPMLITLFAMSYLIMYIIFTLPASRVIDRFGYRTSLIIGATITAVFGILRAVFATNFTAVIIFQFLIAIGQPFLLNVTTKVPANWFPVTERSTAAGLLTMAQYLGFVVPMVLSPFIFNKYGMQNLMTIFAIIAVACALIAIVFTKERPPIPPGPEAEKEDLSIKSMGRLFKNFNFLYVLIIVFVSMGIFNTLLSLIDGILEPRGFDAEQSGLVGAVFVIAGVIGAVILPIISDKIRKRTPLFIVAIALLVPLYLGITFLSGFATVMVVAGVAGFTIMGVAPILFQHGAEVAYPAQEGTSFGLILLMGQISGVLFMLMFEAISGEVGNIVLPMLIFVGLTAILIPITIKMKESNILKALQNKPDK